MLQQIHTGDHCNLVQSYELAFINMFAHGLHARVVICCLSTAALVQSDINIFDPGKGMAKRRGPPPIFRKPQQLIQRLLKVPAAKSWSDHQALYWSKNVRDRFRDRAMPLSFSAPPWASTMFNHFKLLRTFWKQYFHLCRLMQSISSRFENYHIIYMCIYIYIHMYIFIYTYLSRTYFVQLHDQS